MFLATPIIAQADKNGDGKVSIEEFTALADDWFDKLDAGKAGKLSQQQFTDGLNDVLPAPQGFGPPEAGRRQVASLPIAVAASAPPGSWDRASSRRRMPIKTGR